MLSNSTILNLPIGFQRDFDKFRPRNHRLEQKYNNNKIQKSAIFPLHFLFFIFLTWTILGVGVRLPALKSAIENDRLLRILILSPTLILLVYNLEDLF